MTTCAAFFGAITIDDTTTDVTCDGNAETITEGMQCSQCKRCLPISMFYVRNGKPRNPCRDCKNAYATAYNNRPDVKEHRRKRWENLDKKVRQTRASEYHNANRSQQTQRATDWYNDHYLDIKATLRYKSQEARARDIDFDLTEQDFRSFLRGNRCYYCGHVIRTRYGIDRIDSAKGYTASNCVCCCIECNVLKGTKDDVSRFSSDTLGKL